MKAHPPGGALKEAARTAQNSTQLALAQCRTGFTKACLSRKLSVRDTMVAAQGQLASSLAALLKALGAGWREQSAAEKTLPIEDGEK